MNTARFNEFCIWSLCEATNPSDAIYTSCLTFHYFICLLEKNILSPCRRTYQSVLHFEFQSADYSVLWPLEGI